jgi:hypothetical protein
MWQFTPWSNAGLRAKIDEIVPLIRQALDQIPGSDGAVLTGGGVLAQGDFYGESARGVQDYYALRRVLPARRVRETMIVPVTARGCSQRRNILHGHRGSVNGVCVVTVNGQHLLASASNDRTVRLWNPQTGAAALVLSTRHVALAVTSITHSLAIGLLTGVLMISVRTGLDKAVIPGAATTTTQ